jgi:hypothetical protein
MGLSILPPPATMPTIALLAEGITFFAPDGSFTLHVKKTIKNTLHSVDSIERHRPARVNLHESGTMRQASYRTSTAHRFDLILILNFLMGLKVLSRFIQKYL